MRIGDNLEEVGAVFDLTGSGDPMAFRVSTPILVTRWGVSASTALVGTAAVWSLDRTTHAAAGTATRADAVGGKTLTIAAANTGTVIYCEPTSEVICKPGDILHIDSVTAIGTSGSGYPWIQYQKLNWDKTGQNANFSDATPTNRMRNGST